MATAYSSVYSFAANKPAYIIFGAFLVSIFFVDRAASNVFAIFSFVAASAIVIAQARSGALSIPPVAPILSAFLLAIGVRLLLPPYGTEAALPPAAVARVVLIIGLYGLTIYAYLRLGLQSMLWLIAGAACVSTVISFGLYVYEPPPFWRMSILGRGSHPILGAGAICAGIIAAVALLAYPANYRRPRLATASLVLTICVLLLGLYLTGSRGPTLALALALVAAPAVMYSGSRAVLVGCAFGSWALITGSVLLEAPIKAALCPVIELACRSPLRGDVWAAAVGKVSEHPLWGSGYGFRFEGIPHAHNAYLGMAMHYGLPLALLLVAVMVCALYRTATIANPQEKLFIAAMLIFANGFMGSDLSDPVRFLNTHYLFLWLPLLLAFIATTEPPGAADASRSKAEPVASAR